MPRRSCLPPAMALLVAAAGLLTAVPHVTSAAAGPGAAPGATGGKFLPDTFALARIDGKPIRVRDFIAAYFHSYAEFRPSSDSTGRVEFLNTMIHRELMGRAVQEINRPLGFEDRARIREDTERTLGNTLFQRAVLDSVVVSEDEIRKIYETYRYEQHFRQIVFDDKATAERVRADLIAGRIKWDDAVRRYHRAERDTSRGSDLGWVPRQNVDRGVALHIYGLHPTEFSPIIFDRAGYRLVQSVERRPARAAAYASMRGMIRSELKDARVAVLARRLQGQVAARIGMSYDSANVAWAASRFGATRTVSQEGGQATITLDPNLPEFADADTGRVLARHRDGRLTLAEFLHSYSELPALSRPDISDLDAFYAQIDGIVLAPHMAQVAIERGLDRDSMAVATLAERREQMMVDHLYQDSIASRVWVTPAERRKYYDQHVAQYHTYARVTFALIARGSRAGADSLLARLEAGAKAEEILRSDSLAGRVSGSIQERREDEHGTEYYNLLFQELRPGQATVLGPDRAGTFVVLQVLNHDPGRQLSYKEAEAMVDESLQNLKAEKMLNAYLDRRRKRHRVEAHPELVMRVNLTDTTFAQ